MTANRLVAGIAALAIAMPIGIKTSAALPAPYKDGCSGGMSWFYRNVLGKLPAWEGCCDTHDKAYGPGGTSDQRASADNALAACVSAAGHPVVAVAMWAAVRLGGQPFFPFGWRWGFEKDYGATWWYERAGKESIG